MNDIKKMQKIVEETIEKFFIKKNNNFIIEDVIKADISPKEFGIGIYDCLKKCLVNEKDNDSFSYTNIFLNNIGNRLLFIIFRQQSFEHFKEAIIAFEKIVDAENILYPTQILKSNLLLKIGSHNLTKDKIKKIEYICSSKILNSDNNLCDISYKKVVSKSLIKNDLAEYLSKNIVNALIIMSKYSDNKNIVENYFPDTKEGFLYYNEEVFKRASISQLSRINLEKIDNNLLLRKFSINFWKESQNSLNKGRLKNNINKLLSSQLTDSDKIYLLISPLKKLNIDGFKNMNKLYPDILAKINKDSFQEAISNNILNNISDYIIVSEKIKKLAKKYKIDIENKKSLSPQDIWNIILSEKINLEKKEIKKQIGNVKKSTNKKRI